MERPATYVRNPIDSLRGRGKCRRITPTQKRQCGPIPGVMSPKKLLIVISDPINREDDASQCEGTQPEGTREDGTQEGTLCSTR